MYDYHYYCFLKLRFEYAGTTIAYQAGVKRD